MQEDEIKRFRRMNRDELFEKCKKLNLPVFENDDLELLQLLYNAATENQTYESKSTLKKHPTKFNISE